MPDTNMPVVAEAVEAPDFEPAPVADHVIGRIEDVAEEVGGAYTPPPGTEGAVAFTHFDAPSSQDNTVVVLVAKENMEKLPSQAIVDHTAVQSAKYSAYLRAWDAVTRRLDTLEPDYKT